MRRSKRMYKHRDKHDPSLTKIIAVLSVAALLAYGGLRGYAWYHDAFVVDAVQENAQATLAEADDLLDAGEWKKAQEMLQPIATKVQHAKFTPRALMLLARADEQAGQPEQALKRLQHAISAFPSSPERPAAMIAYARLLESQGRHEDALEHFQQVRDTAPPGVRSPALAGIARALERDEEWIEARDMYRQAAREAEWGGPEWQESVEALGRLNVQLFFSTRPTAESKTYTVQSGDSLTSIGSKLNTTVGSLTRANNIATDSVLRVGDKLKYTPKDFRIYIERGTCRLYLFDNKGLFKAYPIGLGMEGYETTLGSYRIGDKIQDPTWHKPGEGPIPPGAPDNELGTRWLGFVPEAEGLPRDLGIHGTIDPPSVGKYSSHGCARMYKEDVEELYDIVVRATPVEVVEQLPDALKNTEPVAPVQQASRQ